MHNPVEIEDIEELRNQQGIDDVDLRVKIRALKVGDFVKLTLLSQTKSFETLLVRITSIRAGAFRGKLANQPITTELSKLPVGTPLTFTPAHIHSIANSRPIHDP